MKERNEVYKNKMALIINYIKKKNLNPDLQIKIKKYF